jgi:hypothetical protein
MVGQWSTVATKGAVRGGGWVPVYYTYRCGVLGVQGHGRACHICCSVLMALDGLDWWLGERCDW